MTKEKMEKINSVVGKITEGFAALAGLFVLIMMFHIAVDVIARNVLGIVFTGTYERSQYVYMPMVVLPAMAFTYRSGVLPRFDGLSKRGPEGWKMFVAFSIALIEIFIFFMLARYSYDSAILAIQDKKAVNAGQALVPTWPVYLFCPIGFTLMLIDCICEKLTMLWGWLDRRKSGEKEAETE